MKFIVFCLSTLVVCLYSSTVECDTSSSLAVFPNPIEDLCVDLFSEKFKDKPSKLVPPYEIRSTKVSETANEVTVQLDIKNNPGFPFIKLRAFLVRVEIESKSGNKEEIIGRFDQKLNANAEVESIFFQRCFPRYYGLFSAPNLAYRNDEFDNLDETSVKLYWTGPNFKGLQFRMTLVHDSDNYWINVVHNISSASTVDSFVSKYELVGDFLDDMPNVLGCGSTKGCIFWPKNQRKISSSLAFLAFKSFNKYISYELSVRLSNETDNQYVKLSFIDLVESSTHVIKDYNSFTIFCGLSADGTVNFQAGFYEKDEYKRIPIVLNNIFKNIRVVKRMEGDEMYLHCRFFIKAQIDVNTEVNDQYRYDLTNAEGYRIAINRGNYYKDTSIAFSTKSYPFITDKRISATDTSLFFGSVFNLSIQLHIIFELVAWMLLNQIALIVNSYFQHEKFVDKENQRPKFFIWYIVLTFSVLLFSWAGIVLLFYHYKEYKLLLENTHAVMGMVTLALNFMQCFYIIVNAFMKKRVSSYLHNISVFIGWLGTLFSILTMFYSAYLPQINNLFRWNFLIVLIFYTVSEFLKLVVFQVTEASRKKYFLVKHNVKKIFRNAGAPGFLLLYISVLELIACVVAFSYFLIMY